MQDIVSKIRDRAHKIASDTEAGIVPRKPNHRGHEIPTDEIDEINILAGRARVVATKTPCTGTESATTPTQAKPPTPFAEPNYEAYRAAHPAILQHLREATKTPQILQGLGWESSSVSMSTTQQQQSGSSPDFSKNRQFSGDSVMFNVPVDLDPTLTMQGQQQQQQQPQQLQGEGVGDDMNIFAPPLWDTPPSSNGNPEELAAVGGGGMGTDEEWGLYMRQFGMQIDPDGSA